MRPSLAVFAFLLAVGLASVPPARGDPDGHPSVIVESSDCSTEPAPVRTIVRAHAAGRGRLRVSAVGEGSLCGAWWGATVEGDRIIVDPQGADGELACGTCAVTLLISGLEAGDVQLVVDGVTRRAHVR